MAKESAVQTITTERFRVRQISVMLVSGDDLVTCPQTTVTMCDQPSICGGGPKAFSGCAVILQVPPLEPSDLPTILRQLEAARPLDRFFVEVLSSTGAAIAVRAAIIKAKA